MRGLFFCLINFVVFLSSDFLIKTEPCPKVWQSSVIDCIMKDITLSRDKYIRRDRCGSW